MSLFKSVCLSDGTSQLLRSWMRTATLSCVPVLLFMFAAIQTPSPVILVWNRMLFLNHVFTFPPEKSEKSSMIYEFQKILWEELNTIFSSCFFKIFLQLLLSDNFFYMSHLIIWSPLLPLPPPLMQPNQHFSIICSEPNATFFFNISWFTKWGKIELVKIVE